MIWGNDASDDVWPSRSYQMHDDSGTSQIFEFVFNAHETQMIQKLVPSVAIGGPLHTDSPSLGNATEHQIHGIFQSFSTWISDLVQKLR